MQEGPLWRRSRLPAVRAPGRGRRRSRRRRARVTGMSGVSPCSWIQRLCGVSQRATERRKPPVSSVRVCHCWMVPLPKVVSPTSLARPLSWSAPATISLALAEPRSTSTTTAMCGIGGHPAGDGLVGDLRAIGERLPEDGARRDELAGDPLGRIDEAAGIAPKVEDDALHAGVDERLELAVEVVGGRGRETVEPDIADGPVGEALAGHDLRLDGVADDGQLEGRGRHRARPRAAPSCPAARGCDRSSGRWSGRRRAHHRWPGSDRPPAGQPGSLASPAACGRRRRDSRVLPRRSSRRPRRGSASRLRCPRSCR